MSDIWLVIAVDYEDFEVWGTFTDEEAAIAYARDRAEHTDWQVVVERHRPDPPVGEKRTGADVEFAVPELGPAHQFVRATFMGSIGYPP